MNTGIYQSVIRLGGGPVDMPQCYSTCPALDPFCAKKGRGGRTKSREYQEKERNERSQGLNTDSFQACRYSPPARSFAFSHKYTLFV